MVGGVECDYAVAWVVRDVQSGANRFEFVPGRVFDELEPKWSQQPPVYLHMTIVVVVMLLSTA